MRMMMMRFLIMPFFCFTVTLGLLRLNSLREIFRSNGICGLILFLIVSIPQSRMQLTDQTKKFVRSENSPLWNPAVFMKEFYSVIKSANYTEYRTRYIICA